MPNRALKVAIIGGGMFFEDIIGQTFKDFARGGIAGALNSIGMSHLAPVVADVEIHVCAVGTRSESAGTAGKIVKWFTEDFPEHEIEACYGETAWQDILRRHKPDVLFVATPDHMHTQPILDAIAAGVDVITEKPLCLSTSEADDIIQKAAAAGRIVAVDMHKRYDPFVREMMTKAPEQYGQINRVRAVLEEPLEVSTEIFAWAEQSNPFAYVGCHWLDVVHHYLQVKPVSVFATGQKNLLVNWDIHHVEIARRRGVDPATFKRRSSINTWDSMDVAVTYDNGMRGDYNNNWINPAEFEGAVNQEIELYGIYGRGMVDQQERGYREAIIGDGSRTRNPSFGGRIQHHGGELEIFGYGKASIAAGLLAIIRRRILGESLKDLHDTYPTAASQRDIVQVIEAATAVAEVNYHLHLAGLGTPVTAVLTPNGFDLIQPQFQETGPLCVDDTMATAQLDSEAHQVATGFSDEFVELDGLEIPSRMIEILTESLAREAQVIAIGYDGTSIVIAMANPHDIELLDKLRFVLDREVRGVMAPVASIQAAIDRHYGPWKM